MSLKKKLGTVVVCGLGLAAIVGGVQYKAQLDKEARWQATNDFEEMMDGSFFEHNGNYIRVSRYSSIGMKVTSVGWCGESSELRTYSLTRLMMNDYDSATGTLTVNGKPYTEIPKSELDALLRARDDKEVKVHSETWSSSDQGLYGPSYTLCEYTMNVFSDDKTWRPSRIKVSAGGRVSQLEGGGYALFPSVTIEDSSAFGAPYMTGERRIKVNGVYKTMSISGIGDRSTLSPITVGGANDMIDLFKRSNTVNVAGRDVSAKGFTSALKKIKVANPDLINSYQL